MPLTRRTFVQTSLASTLVLRNLAAQVAQQTAQQASAQGAAQGSTQGYAKPATAPSANSRTVALVGDSAPFSAAEQTQHLADLLVAHPDAGDSYLKGGAVEQLEQQFAALLGKPDCVYFPTGTLANNVAIRILAGDRRHVLAQEESHLYRDESDAAGYLSGLTLVPLAPGKAAPTFDEVAQRIDDAEKGPYPIAVGAISLESPVRRQDGAGIPLATVQRVSTLARQKGIGMHLDGARLLLFSGLPGFSVAAYTAPFDMVYVSLYKYLRAPMGAVLAGSKESMAKARDLRHIYGGMICHGWQSALPALDALPGFADRFVTARAASANLLAGLQQHGGFTVRPVENGSNIVRVDVAPELRQPVSDRLRAAGVRVLATPDHATLTVFTNESILRRPTGELLAAFTG